MDNWIIHETMQRRDEMLSEAAHVRLKRHAVRGRPNKLRGRIADSALVLSDLLATFAHAVRAKA
ncbi:MAG: hypothetical protein NVS1B14_09590 [Vulcanimicrobiaceae bacterium]